MARYFCATIYLMKNKHSELEIENEPLSRESLNNISELGDILRQIHNRLVKEGKVKVINSKIVFDYNHTTL